MSTTTIPLSKEDEILVKYLLTDRQIASTKADVFRQALRRLAEVESVQAILEAREDIENGRGLRGDLRKLAKQII